MKQQGRALAAVAAVPLVMTLGNSMLIPVIPIIERQLYLSPLQASLIITVYSITAVPLIPIAGFLSDRIGRKTVIIPSLILAGLGGLAAAAASLLLTNPYSIILASRVLQGIGAAGAFPLVLPLTRDLFQDGAEISYALGLIETSNTFGKVVSPILGSLLAALAWYIPFAAIPILAAVSVLAIAFWVKVPSERSKDQYPLPSLPQNYLYKRRQMVDNCLSDWRIIMLVLFGIHFMFGTAELSYQVFGILKVSFCNPVSSAQSLISPADGLVPVNLR